jgi:hypothetical protein
MQVQRPQGLVPARNGHREGGARARQAQRCRGCAAHVQPKHLAGDTPPDGRDADWYVDQIFRPGVWGGQAELQAAADRYRLRIHVHEQGHPARVIEPLHYSFPNPLWNEGPRTDVHVGYLRYGHYVAMLRHCPGRRPPSAHPPPALPPGVRSRCAAAARAEAEGEH